MALSIVTAPTFEPLKITDVKDRLRITGTQEDNEILQMIRGATKWCEHELNWRLCTQTWNLFLDWWPVNVIRLPFPPLQSVTHIKYFDVDDVQQTLTVTTDYLVDSESYPARIEPVDSWPGLFNKLNPIEIQFICGFSDKDDIAEDIKDAIYLRVADLYEHRQNSSMGSGRMAMVENTEPSHNLLMNYKLYNEV